jgi:hypothetical protein
LASKFETDCDFLTRCKLLCGEQVNEIFALFLLAPEIMHNLMSDLNQVNKGLNFTMLYELWDVMRNSSAAEMEREQIVVGI